MKICKYVNLSSSRTIPSPVQEKRIPVPFSTSLCLVSLYSFTHHDKHPSLSHSCPVTCSTFKRGLESCVVDEGSEVVLECRTSKEKPVRKSYNDCSWIDIFLCYTCFQYLFYLLIYSFISFSLSASGTEARLRSRRTRPMRQSRKASPTASSSTQPPSTTLANTSVPSMTSPPSATLLSEVCTHCLHLNLTVRFTNENQVIETPTHNFFSSYRQVNCKRFAVFFIYVKNFATIFIIISLNKCELPVFMPQ